MGCFATSSGASWGVIPILPGIDVVVVMGGGGSRDHSVGVGETCLNTHHQFTACRLLEIARLPVRMRGLVSELKEK